MADILIKNMKMPARCVDCRFCDEIDGTCIALNDNSTACITGKPKWCPLVEVPSSDVTELKNGKWCEFMEDPINQRNYGGQTGYYECSNCKFVEDYRPNFCPNCGSDMRKANET